jgi:hypothetical protein
MATHTFTKAHFQHNTGPIRKAVRVELASNDIRFVQVWAVDSNGMACDITELDARKSPSQWIQNWIARWAKQHIQPPTGIVKIQVVGVAMDQ